MAHPINPDLRPAPEPEAKPSGEPRATLFISLTSPFARKVRVTLHEKGVADQVVEQIADPWQDDPGLLAVNPLLQVPALRLGDGLCLGNSDTILGWVERSFPQPALWPVDNAERSRAESIAALAQGIIEYAVFIVLERRRAEAEQSPAMIARRQAGIEHALIALEARFDCATDHFGLDAIGLACALAYLDFRHPDMAWRPRAPRLAGWLDWANRRPSMLATRPPA